MLSLWIVEAFDVVEHISFRFVSGSVQLAGCSAFRSLGIREIGSHFSVGSWSIEVPVEHVVRDGRLPPRQFDESDRRSDAVSTTVIQLNAKGSNRDQSRES